MLQLRDAFGPRVGLRKDLEAGSFGFPSGSWASWLRTGASGLRDGGLAVAFSNPGCSASCMQLFLQGICLHIMHGGNTADSMLHRAVSADEIVA